MWESLIIVSVILVYFFTRNENKKREEQERIEEERVIREEERVIREENEREERVIREQERIEEEREKKEQERLVRKKELEEKRKKKEFWFGLNGLDTEKELNKVFEKLGFETELTPPSNDEGIDHVLNGEIVVQTKNTQSKVSRPDLQRFWGSWKDSHKKGIFVSIHGFSNTCEEFVRDKPILLYDVDDVVRMMEGKKPEWNE
jgi:restriction endonuclease Mrr